MYGAATFPSIVMGAVRLFSPLRRTMDLNFCSWGENKEKFLIKNTVLLILLILQYFDT